MKCYWQIAFFALTFAIFPVLTGCDGKGEGDTGLEAGALAVYPTLGGVGTSMEVEIDATFSLFSFEDTQVDFGAGILVDSVRVKDGWTLVADITIEADAELGNREVTATVEGRNWPVDDGFDVIAESFSVTPNSGKLGETLEVELFGTSTTWEAGTTWPNFDDGIEIIEFTVLSATIAQATIAIEPDSTPGPRDIWMQNGPEVVILYNGFTVDRVGLAASFDPDEVYQGETVSFTVTARDTQFDPTDTELSFLEDGDAIGDVVVSDLTVLDATNLYGQMQVSNAATLGWRDVLITTDDEGVLIEDAFEILDAPPDLSEVVIGLTFYVSRAIDNSTGALSESVVAYAIFQIPLDPPCGGGGSMGDGPQPYDNNGVFETPEASESEDDCPTPESVGAGDYVWLESDANVVTLERTVDSDSGTIFYWGNDLTLDDYVFDNWYDLHTQGEEGGLPEYLLEDVQPTVPGDWYLQTPALYGDYTVNRAEDFTYTWGVTETGQVGALSYPDAIFYTGIFGSTLVESGKGGFAACYPWDDGEHTYTSSELSQLDPNPVYFVGTSYMEGPEFGFPDSVYQENVAPTYVELQAYMVLE